MAGCPLWVKGRHVRCKKPYPLCSLKRTSCSFDQFVGAVLFGRAFCSNFSAAAFTSANSLRRSGLKLVVRPAVTKRAPLKSHAATSLTISATGLRPDFFRCLGRCFSTYIFYAKMCECEPPFAGLGPVGLGQIIYRARPHGFYALFSAAPKICTKFETRVDYQKTYGTQSWIACLALVLWCGINW